jgi:calcineurin-like phosphoesterase family protein
MTIWFTSDLHFGHSNIIRYCNRPYATSDEMDEALIANWNARVKPHESIYIIGDVFFYKKNPQKCIDVMNSLNGNKRLVYGNHDWMIRNDPSIQACFKHILPDLTGETFQGIYTVMCHYPLLTWNKAHHGTYMLHGHCHNTIPFDDRYRRLDVGVDANNYAPISWEEIVLKMSAVKGKGDVRDH